MRLACTQNIDIVHKDQNLHHATPAERIAKMPDEYDDMDNLNEPLLPKAAKGKRFISYMKALTRAGKAAKNEHSKIKGFSEASRSKKERAFANVEQGIKYIDKALTYTFPPATIISTPIAWGAGQLKTGIDLKNAFKNIGMMQPLLLSQNLANFRYELEKIDSPTLASDEDSPIQKVLDAMDQLIQMVDKADDHYNS